MFYVEGGESPDAPAMLFAAVVMFSPIWLAGWMAFAAAYLVGYRGGGRLWTLASGSIPTALLSFVANAVSAAFVWLSFAQTQWWLGSRLPFTLWLLAAGIFVQYLRAAGVQRRLQRAAEPR